MPHRLIPHQLFSPRGFTLVELLMVVAIIGMLAILTVQQFAEDRDVLRDRTLAANLNTIQTAIERYHTDTGQYPLFLLGGDVEGWRRWHTAYDEPTPDPTLPQNAWLHDPLIAGGYLTSYPENPFVDDGGKAMLLQTSRPGQSMGDPRFGLNGNLAGNGLDDPKLFQSWYGVNGTKVETRRTQVAAQQLDANIHPYAMGGRRGPPDRRSPSGFHLIRTWWPGSFCYRGVQSAYLARKGWTLFWPNMWMQSNGTEAYVIGIFGSTRQDGTDAVRLESLDPVGNQIYYEVPPPWSSQPGNCPVGWRTAEGFVESGLPEVLGGGSAWDGPFFPYSRRPLGESNVMEYGSPDGIPDGLIHFVHGEDQLSAAI